MTGGLGQGMDYLFLIISSLQLLAALKIKVHFPLVPYGSEHGDSTLPKKLNRCSSPPLSVLFPYFGSNETDLYVCPNGILSFHLPFVRPKVTSFSKLDASQRLVVPYWAKVDNRFFGSITYRILQASEQTLNLQQIISSTFAISTFESRYEYVATYYQVPLDKHTSDKNTFQVVLVTDGELSFVLVSYGDIQGGEGANIGFKSGNRSYMLPQALTSATIDIETTSNVGVPGLYVFRVDLVSVMGPINNYTGFRFCCPSQTLSFNISYSWPETEDGGTAILPCRFSSGNATRQCGPEQMWLQTNTSLCERAANIIGRVLKETVNLSGLNEQLNRVAFAMRIIEDDNIQQAMQLLDMVSTYLISIIDMIVDNETKVITIPVMIEIVKIIDSLQKWPANLFVETSTTSRIIMSFESLAAQHAQSALLNESVAVFGDDFAFKAENFPLDTLQKNGQSISFNEGNEAVAGDLVASIVLPSGAFTNISDRTQIGYFFALYTRASLFPLRNMENITSAVADRTTIVGSPIIAATVGRGLSFNNLQSLVKINLSILPENNASVIYEESVVCVSWDFSAAENHGNWVTDGCIAVNIGNGRVTCQCNHLTNFAVLIDICSRVDPDGCKKSEGFQFALSVITYIGVVFSMIGLIITVVTFLVFKKLRDRKPTVYHIQLCLAIFFLLVVFVAGVEKTAEFGGCITASVLIHYFTLASILWMLAETLLMFQKLVVVFHKISKKRIVITSFMAWLTPIVPVGIPLIIDLTNGSEASNDLIIKRDKFCFLSHPLVFWLTFLGPLLAVVLFNTVIIIVVLVLLLLRQRSMKQSSKQKSVKIKKVIRLTVSVTGIMFLFGSSWLLAALTITVEQINQTGEFLFTFFNSLQGFFIFIFFCIVSKEARECWKEVLSCGKYKSTYLNPTPKIGCRNSSAVNILKNSVCSNILNGIPAGKKNYCNSKPTHTVREDKKMEFSSTQVDKKKDNKHNLNITSETEFNGMEDISDSNQVNGQNKSL